MEPRTSRVMWRLLEPIHAVTYFAPESISALQSTGLRGFWMSYFAGRAAPMGPVAAAVVEATFYNFSSRLVRRAIPDAWTFASPAAVLAARSRGAVEALTRHVELLGADGAASAVDQLRDAVDGLNCDGRPLGAANFAVELDGGDVVGSLWQLTTTLREYRGDGHVAHLVSAGITGLEAHLTLVGTRAITREVLQGARGFTDEEWDAAARGLVARGLLLDDGSLSDEGVALRRELEDATDRSALAPWSRLGQQRCDELIGMLAPVARSIVDAGVIPVLNPIGLPTD